MGQKGFRMFSAAALTVAFIGAGVSSAQNQFATINVQEAIDYGQKQRSVAPYELRASFLGSGRVVAFYTTPFLRVALASNNAKKKYQPFTVTDVTPEMLAPELRVVAGSIPAHKRSPADNRIANVVTVVVMPKGSKERGEAIQPTSTTPMDETYQNLFGFTTTGRGLVAVFPLAVLDEDNEFRIIFDENIEEAVCTDCKASIRLRNVR